MPTLGESDVAIKVYLMKLTATCPVKKKSFMRSMETPVTAKSKSSMIVPSVQELAKKKIHTVPQRYIRTEVEQINVADSTAMALLPSVPVINLNTLLSGSTEELEKLDSACKNWGFFQVEKIKAEIQDLFNLQLEEKKKLWQHPGSDQGFGQLFVMSEEQKLDWSDMFLITTLPTVLRDPDLFAKIPLSLRESLEGYSQELERLAMSILGKMADALKIDVEEANEFFSGGNQFMRMNYYPACPQPEKVIGFSSHSDGCALTILLQINEAEGLEIRKNGKWLLVKPLPNAFIVNVGNILEIVSNGVYKSIEHRATVNASKERLSVATFYSTKLDAELGPAKSLINENNPAVYRRIPMKKYYTEFFARKLDGRAYLDLQRI